MSAAASTWSFYNASTGALAQGTLTCSTAQVAANTPEGWTAIEGRFDHLGQRVNLATGQVVDYQPPAPANDALRTWAWDADTRRWVASRTELAVANAARAERDARLAACDWVTVRALELGDEIPADWLTYRQALRDVPDQPGFPASVEWPAPPAV
jgi:hypothetical protein